MRLPTSSTARAAAPNQSHIAALPLSSSDADNSNEGSPAITEEAVAQSSSNPINSGEGNVLKRLRESRQLSIRKISALVGLKPTTWSDAESDRRKLRQANAERVAEVFGLDPAELEGVTDWGAAARGAQGGAASRGKARSRPRSPKDYPERNKRIGITKEVAAGFEPGSVEYRLYHREPVSVEEVVARIAWLRLQAPSPLPATGSGPGPGNKGSLNARGSRSIDSQTLANWLISRLQIKK